MQITRAFLKEHGLLPRKVLGQHLLFDGRVLGDVVTALDVRPGDRVIEIGAGCGTLTERLLEVIGAVGGAGAALTSIEIDARYADFLARTFGAHERFRVLHADVLKLVHVFGEGAKVVGNLPYYISSPILRMLFRHSDRIPVIVVMLQKEVGMRLCAGPGDRDFGLLSIMRMLHYDAEIVRYVDRRLFMPAPEVDSAVVRLRAHEPLLNAEDEERLLHLLKQAFGARRKMLKNTLKFLGAPEVVERFCNEADIDIRDRAENISLERWIRLLNVSRPGTS